MIRLAGRGDAEAAATLIYAINSLDRTAPTLPMTAAMTAVAELRGASRLWWGVDEGNGMATAFWRAIGAKTEGRFSGEFLEGAALRRMAAEHRA